MFFVSSWINCGFPGICPLHLTFHISWQKFACNTFLFSFQCVQHPFIPSSIFLWLLFLNQFHQRFVKFISLFTELIFFCCVSPPYGMFFCFVIIFCSYLYWVFPKPFFRLIFLFFKTMYNWWAVQSVISLVVWDWLFMWKVLLGILPMRAETVFVYLSISST